MKLKALFVALGVFALGSPAFAVCPSPGTGQCAPLDNASVGLAPSVVGSTPVASGTSGYVLYNNAGALGNKALSFSDITGSAAPSQLPVMVGDSGSGGVKGAVPAPAAGDAAAGKYLKADGTFAVPATSGVATSLSVGGTSVVGGTDGRALYDNAGFVGELVLAPSATTDTTNASNISSGTLAVARGGSGAGTITAHGVMLGEGTSAFGVTAAMTNGQLLVGQTGSDPLPKTLSGDGTLSAAGAITVTKTNGSNFAASATTDTTNAANISSGTLPAARLQAVQLGITRAQIASNNLTGYTKFTTTTDSCGWIAGSVSGPMAIQDSASNWWQLDLSAGVVNVLCFGGDATGVGDSGSAISAAATAGEAAGIYTLTFPAGTYLACNSGSTISFGANGIRLVGAGPDSTVIKCTSGTQDMFSWSGSSFDGGASGIKFLATGMTGGNMISATSVQRFRLYDVVFGNGYNGVYLQDQNVASIAKAVFTGQSGAYAIKNKGLTSGSANVLDLDDVTIGFSTATSGSPDGVIFDGGVNTVDMRHVAVVKGRRGMSLINSPSLGGTTVLFITALDFQSDSPYDACVYLDGAGGTTEGHLFTDLYCHHSANSYGVYVSSSVQHASFKGGVNTGNYLNGFYIAGRYVSISDMQIATNGQSGSGTYAGVELTGTSIGTRLHGNLIGAWTGYGTEMQSYGVLLDASATLYEIIGNNLRGNVTGDYLDNASDASGLIGPNVALATSKIKFPQPIQYTGSGTIAANGSVATSVTSVGATGSHTTIQEWLVIYNASGTARYVPLY